MFKHLWMSGTLAAFLVFGIKIGAGLAVQMNHPDVPAKKKWAFFTGSILTYMVLFFGMYSLITFFNLIEYLDIFSAGLKYGMILHVLLAAGLFMWGVRLLLQNNKNHRHIIKASMLLVLPCPVCASVILLNLSLAFLTLPMSPEVTTAALFGCFLCFIMITLFVITLFKNHIKSMDSFLGFSMVTVASYFVLTILIAPIYPEIQAAFTMAASNNPSGELNLKPFLILAGTALALLIAGFYRSYYKKVK